MPQKLTSSRTPLFRRLKIVVPPPEDKASVFCPPRGSNRSHYLSPFLTVLIRGPSRLAVLIDAVRCLEWILSEHSRTRSPNTALSLCRLINAYPRTRQSEIPPFFLPVTTANPAIEVQLHLSQLLRDASRKIVGENSVG